MLNGASRPRSRNPAQMQAMTKALVASSRDSGAMKGGEELECAVANIPDPTYPSASRHCEERSDAAIHSPDCFASLQ
jgi:hypothetical protein